MANKREVHFGQTPDNNRLQNSNTLGSERSSISIREQIGHSGFSQYIQVQKVNDVIKYQLDTDDREADEEMQYDREILAKKVRHEKKLPKLIKQTMAVTELWNKAYRIDLMEAKKKISASQFAKGTSSKYLPSIKKVTNLSIQEIVDEDEQEETKRLSKGKNKSQVRILNKKSLGNIYHKKMKQTRFAKHLGQTEISMPFPPRKSTLLGEIRHITEPELTQIDLCARINQNFRVGGSIVEDHPDEEASFLDDQDKYRLGKPELLSPPKRHPMINYHKNSRIQVPLHYSGNKATGSHFMSHLSASKHSSTLWDEGRQTSKQSRIIGSILDECDYAISKGSRLPNHLETSQKDVRITHKIVDMLKATVDHKRYLQEIGAYLL